MKTIRSFFARVAALFTSPKGQESLKQAADLAAKSMPYIDIAAKIVTGVTPTTLDDMALSMIHARYPRLFDGSIHDGEELKLYAFGAAADLLQQKYPAVSTSVARLAVQVAYTGSHA